MANAQIRNRLGTVDKRYVQGDAANRYSGTTTTNVKDVTSMRARLTAIDSATFTSSRLDQMTTNDMLYAIRLNDEVAGI